MNSKFIIGIFFLILFVVGLPAYLKYKHEIDITPIPTADLNFITYRNSSTTDIVVDTPTPGAVINNDLIVTGKARAWYFEGSFPVQVRDSDGAVIAQGVAQAQGDWMTDSFVAFKADIKLPKFYVGQAILVLKKDNPSGMREHDASISFPFMIVY